MKILFKKLLACTLAFCSLQTISLSADGWTPQQVIPTSRTPSLLQYDPSNNLLVSWADSNLFTINAAFLSPLGILSTPVTLATGTRNVPVESVNPATGDAVVVWQTNTEVQARAYQASTQTWLPVQILDTIVPGDFVDFLVVTFDPTSGKSVACWEYFQNVGGPIVKAAVLPTVAGVWQAPVPISISAPIGGGNPFFLNNAVPANGPYAGVCWGYDDAATARHYHMELFSAATNSWAFAHDETSTFVKPNTSILAVDNSGNMAFLFNDGGIVAAIIGWGTGGNLQTLSNVNSDDPLLAVDNAGRAYAVWLTPFAGDPSNIVHEKTFFFGTSTQWSSDATVNAPNTFIAGISPDQLGNLYVAIESNNTIVQTATLTVGATPLAAGSWSPIITVSDPLFDSELNRTFPIAANASGAVLISWFNFDTGFIEEVHKPAGGSYSSILVALSDPLLNGDPSSYISPAGNKAISDSGGRASTFLTVFIETPPPPVIGPNPPANFIGRPFKNKFLTQTDHINGLTWTASPSVDVVNYQLYRDGVLIAVIPASGPLVYQDHNRHKHVAYTYTLYAVDSLGNRSTPVVVVL